MFVIYEMIYDANLQFVARLGEGGSINESVARILYQGQSEECFENETGLTVSQLGGFKLNGDNQIVFDSAKYQNYLESQKPFAMGLDILKQAQLLFNIQHPLIRAVLLAKFDYIIITQELAQGVQAILNQNGALAQLIGALIGQPVSLKAFLESETCNPLRKSDFDFVLAFLQAVNDPIIDDNIKQQYLMLAGQYAQSVRFAPEIPLPNTGGAPQMPGQPPLQNFAEEKARCLVPSDLDKRKRKCGKRAASERQNKH